MGTQFKIKHWYLVLCINMDTKQLEYCKPYKTFEPAYKLYKKHDLCIAIVQMPRYPNEDEPNVEGPLNLISQKELFRLFVQSGIIEANPSLSVDQKAVTDVIEKLEEGASLDEIFKRVPTKEADEDKQKEKSSEKKEGGKYKVVKMPSANKLLNGHLTANPTVPFSITKEQLEKVEQDIYNAGGGNIIDLIYCIDRIKFYTDNDIAGWMYHPAGVPSMQINWVTWHHPEFQNCPELFGFDKGWEPSDPPFKEITPEDRYRLEEED